MLLYTGLVEPGDYKLIKSYKTHDQAVTDCSKEGRGHQYRLARISTQTQLQEAQKVIKKKQNGFWTALSFQGGRGKWLWDGSESASNLNRELTLSHQQEAAIKNPVCFYVNYQNSTLITDDCQERKQFLCEKVKKRGKKE